MRIAVSYRGIPHAPGWATGDHLVKAFNELGHDAFPYGRYHSQKATNGAGKGLCGVPLGPAPHDPDLLVWLECGDQDAQYWELSGYGCPKVIWDFDTALHPQLTQAIVARLQPQKVFLANPDALGSVPGATYLPYAAPSQFSPPEAIAREGAAMVGNAFPERVAFAEAAGVPLEQCNQQDYIRKLWRLAIHVHNHASGGPGLLVMRIWETLASGALLLTEDDKTLYRHFIPGAHCAVYHNPEDCKAKIAHYLEHPAERDLIASRAQEEIAARHTYVHRAQAILASL